MQRKTMVLISIILVFIIVSIYFSSTLQSSTLSVTNPNPTTFSTTGPTAPPVSSNNIISGQTLQTLSITSDGNLLDETPKYVWLHGCGPTAVGMLFGYYDIKYNTHFLDGNAEQLHYVANSIVSNQHYNDYSQPIDNDYIIADKSETGNPHSDNSLADFLGTSVSIDGLQYGWGFVSKIATGIEQYAAYKGYDIQAQYYDGFTISDFKKEIDEGRPFIAFINGGGSNYANHFVTVVGYDHDNIIFHTTWDDPSIITTPLLPEDEQFGVAGIILTTHAISGEGMVDGQSIPGFEIITLMSALVISILLIKRSKAVK